MSGYQKSCRANYFTKVKQTIFMSSHIISSFFWLSTSSTTRTREECNVQRHVKGMFCLQCKQREKKVGIIVISHELPNSIIEVMHETYFLKREKTQPQGFVRMKCSSSCKIACVCSSQLANQLCNKFAHFTQCFGHKAGMTKAFPPFIAEC